MTRKASSLSVITKGKVPLLIILLPPIFWKCRLKKNKKKNSSWLNFSDVTIQYLAIPLYCYWQNSQPDVGLSLFLSFIMHVTMKIILFYSILFYFPFKMTLFLFPSKRSDFSTQSLSFWSWNLKNNNLNTMLMYLWAQGKHIRQLCRVYIIRTMCFHILAPMTEKIFQALESELGDMIGDILMLELQIQKVSSVTMRTICEGL